MGSGKNFSGWVPGEYVKDADRLVRESGKTQSEFVAGLVIAAVEQAPPDLKSGDVLVELARHYHPTLVEELAAAMKKHQVSQPRAIARVLESVLDALNRGVDLTKPIGVYNSAEQMNAFLANQPAGPALIERMRDLVESFDTTTGPIPNSPVSEVIREHKGKAGQDAKSAAPSSRQRSPAKSPAHTRPDA